MWIDNTVFETISNETNRWMALLIFEVQPMMDLLHCTGYLTRSSSEMGRSCFHKSE